RLAISDCPGWRSEFRWGLRPFRRRKSASDLLDSATRMKQLVTARIAAAAALVAFVAAAAPTASHAQTTATANWVQTSTQGPSPRVGPAIAYDLVDRKTVLFGGGGTSDTLGDTWQYDGKIGRAHV